MFPREIEGFIAVVAYRCHRCCMAIKADIMLVVLLGVGKIWLVGSTPQRQMMMKVLCVVDEKDFLQFRRARAKIFFLSRACFRQHEQPILPGYPSETHV
jgi:hypothetical protein